MEEIYYTLVFIINEDKVLLGFKKRGLGNNTWNGFGGKLEHNEDILSCATRELLEESNLVVDRQDLNYLGVVTYINISTIIQKRIVYIFTSTKITGDLQETEEMTPKWYNHGSVPYENMWPDLKFWLPLVLKNKWLKADFIYKSNQEILEFHVTELTRVDAENSTNA